MLPAYLAAFALTLAVEIPVYAITLRAVAGISWTRAVLLAAGVNVATHPVTWWSLRPLAGAAGYPWILAAAEIAVCAAEWGLLVLMTRRTGRRRADIGLLAALSLAANATSALAGLLIIG